MFDQPLWALAKYVQWSWPSDYGEDKFIVTFGGLHIEMNSWKAFGRFLDRSRWTTLLSKASVTTMGIADSFLKCSDVGQDMCIKSLY